ncbi:MAG: glycosyltransferase family 61 protein [Gallionella sp.]
MYTKRQLVLQPVHHVGLSKYARRSPPFFTREHLVELPDVGLYEFSNTEVIGGSEMLLTAQQEVLYDEIALGDIHRFGSKSMAVLPHNNFMPYLPAVYQNQMLCVHKLPTLPTLPCAISLLKDHGKNYYHWVLEVLPRAVLAVRHMAWQGAPLLIDSTLPKQLIESLHLIAQDNLLIPIPEGLRVQVEKLYFPAPLSITHDCYGDNPQATDFLIAPEAVYLLRETYLPMIQSPARHKSKYIYIARTGGGHRAMRNEAEVIRVVKKHGFSIVFPGEMSFLDQVSMFADADIIVGPTGAGMANIVFSPSKCIVLVLAPSTRNANYYLFAQLAQHVGQEIIYVEGRADRRNDLHSNFEINTQVLCQVVSECLLKKAIENGK